MTLRHRHPDEVNGKEIAQSATAVGKEAIAKAGEGRAQMFHPISRRGPLRLLLRRPRTGQRGPAALQGPGEPSAVPGRTEGILRMTKMTKKK